MRFVIGKFNGTIMAINEQKIVAAIEESPGVTRIHTTTGEDFCFEKSFEGFMEALIGQEPE